jgi:hypothetical protein
VEIHLGREKKDSFYPLIASLFTAAGLPSNSGAIGDTSNRIDAHIYHPKHSSPVEVKSPTEAGGVITLKAVQQALENKVVLQTRQLETYPSEPETTSLVVGYTYPADRSDVGELVSDVRAVFGVSVGLLELRDLYEWIWTRYVLREPLDLDGLWTLCGPYRA